MAQATLLRRLVDERGLTYDDFNRVHSRVVLTCGGAR
jgi:hypothetical protein